jgi:carbon monoxide dehydrogenase subunit G
MPVITETVETELHVEATFDYVANFENIVEWDPGVKAVRKVTDGEPGVGSEYDLDIQYGSSPLSMTYRITEWDPPRRIVLEGDGARSFAIDRISFLPTATGTSVEYEADIRLKGIYRAAEPFLGKLFRRVGDGAREGMDSRLRELAAEAAEEGN